MHFVIDNVSDLAEIDGIDDLIVAVLFVVIEILSLTAVAWEKLDFWACSEDEDG